MGSGSGTQWNAFCRCAIRSTGQCSRQARLPSLPVGLSAEPCTMAISTSTAAPSDQGTHSRADGWCRVRAPLQRGADLIAEWSCGRHVGPTVIPAVRVGRRRSAGRPCSTSIRGLLDPARLRRRSWCDALRNSRPSAWSRSLGLSRCERPRRVHLRRSLHTSAA